MNHNKKNYWLSSFLFDSVWLLVDNISFLSLILPQSCSSSQQFYLFRDNLLQFLYSDVTESGNSENIFTRRANCRLLGAWKYVVLICNKKVHLFLLLRQKVTRKEFMLLTVFSSHSITRSICKILKLISWRIWRIVLWFWIYSRFNKLKFHQSKANKIAHFLFV